MDLRMQMALGAFVAVALTAPVASAQDAAPQAAALPAPPYARNEASPALRGPASYGGEQTYDRYGGGTPHPRIAATAAYAPPAAYAGPRLGWAGKAEEAAAPARAAPYAQRSRPGGYPAMAYAPPAAPIPMQQASANSPAAPTGWTYVQPIGQAAPVRPASIYDAPAPVMAAPAAAAPVQVAQAAPAYGVRHYSVHRDYGMQPDAIPLPPQFFGATADLTQPATDEPVRKVTTAAGKSRNALQPEGGQ